MKRALLLACLLATPATAQVGSSFNPYTNPYSAGPIYFRPYYSLDRLNIQHQDRVSQLGYFANRRASWPAAPVTRQPGFQYFPHYPLLNATQSSSLRASRPAASVNQPLRQQTLLPVEFWCDPYLDNDGCLNEYADW